MHTLTFYPLGNADSYTVQLATGRLLLFDYANVRNANDDSDKRIDLDGALRDLLAALKRDDFDVVAFTHLDDDHIHGASEFFHLDHDRVFQGDGRIRITQLWVPAAAITENPDDLGEEAKIIQAEARHRLREGTGVRVFSRPSTLKAWLESEGVSLESRADLITDAGQLVPGFDKAVDGVEFFVHSPFAARHEGELIDRNSCSLVFQATFDADGYETRFILSADSPHDVLADLVRVTKAHRNDERLAWDIFKLPHHCSYRSLGPDKGKDVTVPVPEVAWLFGQGAQRGMVVSPSDPIPTIDTDQPPHRQAANYYRAQCRLIDGELKVTMEHPTTTRPEPVVVTIGKLGAIIEKRITAPTIVPASRRAPRAG